MNKIAIALGAFTLVVAGGCATTQEPPAAEPPAAAAAASPAADAAIAEAEKALAAAKKADGEWQLIDKATGSRSVSLSELLEAAQKARDAGDTDEAIRIAKRVTNAANLGVEQSKQQMGAKPYYPK